MARKKLPRDLKSTLLRMINISMEVDEPRLRNLAQCLCEDLAISGCSNMQGLIALLVALRRSCDEAPDSEIIRQIFSEMLWLPQTPSMPSSPEGPLAPTS